MANKNKSKSFEQWLNEMDKVVKEKAYLSYQDLPDCSYSQWYEDGLSPKQAANKAISNAKKEYGM